MKGLPGAILLALLCVAASAVAKAEKILAVKGVLRTDIDVRLDYDQLRDFSRNIKLYAVQAPSLKSEGYTVQGAERRLLSYDGTQWEMWAALPDEWQYVALAYQRQPGQLQLLQSPFLDLRALDTNKKTLKEIAVPVGDPIDFWFEFLRVVGGATREALKVRGSPKDLTRGTLIGKLRAINGGLAFEAKDAEALILRHRKRIEELESELKVLRGLHEKSVTELREALGGQIASVEQSLAAEKPTLDRAEELLRALKGELDANAKALTEARDDESLREKAEQRAVLEAINAAVKKTLDAQLQGSAAP